MATQDCHFPYLRGSTHLHTSQDQCHRRRNIRSLPTGHPLELGFLVNYCLATLKSLAYSSIHRRDTINYIPC